MSGTGGPSIQEIADLVARLRALSAAGASGDAAERAAFLADKDALLARIAAADKRRGLPASARDADDDDVVDASGDPLEQARRAVDALPGPGLDIEGHEQLARSHTADQAASHDGDPDAAGWSR